MDAIALKSRAITSRSTPASDALLDVRFRKTFEAAGIGIAICDLEGRIVEANLALERLLGYEPAELVGIDLWKEPRKLGEANRIVPSWQTVSLRTFPESMTCCGGRVNCSCSKDDVRGGMGRSFGDGLPPR